MKIKIDSRKIEEGDTFLALRGVHDAHQYIPDAIKRKAACIIAEEGNYDIPTLIVPDTKAYLIEYLDEHCKEQLKSLKIIAMTGTNGKTTTCFLLHKALNKLGHKAAYIGTIGFYIDDKIRELPNTTPEVLEIYEMLLESVTKKCEYVVMEASSIALFQKRLGNLTFDYAIFSNLTKDHLDYHQTMENYCDAKKILFTKLKKQGKAIINRDDPAYEAFALEENHNIFYGMKEADYQISNYSIDHHRTVFNVKQNGQLINFESELLGKHNLYNLLAVIAVLREEGFSYDDIKSIIRFLEAPAGRMESIRYKTNQIIIDYAHTPDAVFNIVTSARELHPEHIYTIVGCGGDRDKTKRPEMAKIAADLSDHVIFTSDNPRTEDPEQILKDMIQGLDNDNYEIEVNREKAIVKGIQRLENDDILLVLGKGHEDYQILGTTKVPFDDKKIVLAHI